MNKLVIISLLIVWLSATAHATSFDDAFRNATTTGQLRFGYISSAPDVTPAAKTTTGAALGGEIKFETAKWNNIQFAVAPYFVEKLDALSGDASNSELNTDFFNAKGKAFAYVGEAYVNYDFAKGSLRLGRQKLDNPFINTDDIRMFSNTFNAVWLNMNLSKSLTLETGIVGSWAGFDSTQDIFSKASNEGVTALGVNYKQSDAFSTQAWYYNFDKEYSLLYADVTYTTGGLEVGAQMANYSEAKSTSTKNADGSVIGVSVSYAVGSFTLGAVINSGANAAGKSADLGLGGGNFYAAMDETTIAGLNNVKAHVFSVEYAVSDKFTAAVALGHFEDTTKTTNIDETNLVLGYSVKDNLNIEFVHAMVDNKGDPADAGTNFSRQTARVTYTF